MARRYDHSRDELKSLTLAAAEKIIETEGVDAVTARRLAADIGYTPGTLYNMFGGVDDIIAHVNHTTLEQLEAALQALETSASPRDTLSRMADIYMSFIIENENRWSSLFMRRKHSGDEFPDWYAEKIQKIMDLIAGVIAPLFAHNEKDRARNAARQIYVSVHGVTSLYITGRLGVITEQAATDMMRDMIDAHLKAVLD